MAKVAVENGIERPQNPSLPMLFQPFAGQALRLDENLAASHMAQSLVSLVSDEPDNSIKFAPCEFSKSTSSISVSLIAKAM